MLRLATGNDLFEQHVDMYLRVFAYIHLRHSTHQMQVPSSTHANHRGMTT